MSAITKDEASKVAQLAKEQEEKAESNLAAQTKEEEQKQALERKAVKARKHQDKEIKKRVTAGKPNVEAIRSVTTQTIYET